MNCINYIKPIFCCGKIDYIPDDDLTSLFGSIEISISEFEKISQMLNKGPDIEEDISVRLLDNRLISSGI